jgi:hypothetical protein
MVAIVPAMRRVHRLGSALALLFMCSCGDAGKPAAIEKARDTKKADGTKKADDAKKVDDTKKAGDAKAPDAAEPGGQRFDATQDKSGVLARSAAVIKIAGSHGGEALRSLSHDADKQPTLETLCEHEAEVGKTDVSPQDCEKANKRHVVQLGPELYAVYAACIMKSASADDIANCHAAEREVQTALHDKPHGDGLDAAVCERLFTQFVTLAKADAGDQADAVASVLEEVRTDVLTACHEQGTKAEIDCAMKATTMAELSECASKLL